MEHKIILGGKQFLPFARSRITALRATGLVYASQSFEVDGVSIKVRIQPGHEFIRLEGGPTPVVRLDSGLIDIGAYASLEPARYHPRALQWAGSATDYCASFTPTEPVSAYLKNTSASSAGQLAGVVSVNKATFKGLLPYNNTTARSCGPGTVPDTSTTPAGWKDDPQDELLVYKKTMMALCPASIFTGRCRLYVQALYGAPLYADNKLDALGSIKKAGTANDLPELVAPAGTSAPYLKIKPYQAVDDTAAYQSLAVTTGSGVFLDPATGKHWLMNTSAEALAVYPLIGSPTAERLRRYLFDNDLVPDGKRLNAEDREHLEAYILSTCRPWVAKGRAYPFSAGTAISNYSMGYGWHWNWDGLKADIVNSVSFWQQRVILTNYYGMRSTHFRLTVTATQTPATPETAAVTEFAVSASVVEGPKDWTVERALWCIVEPNWGAGTLAKVTEPFTAMLDSFDAPFYAFYTRNELKVCRVAGVSVTTTSTRTNSEPAFDASGFGMVTNGMLGGWGETMSFTGKYYAVTFSCGSESFGPLHAYRNESGTLDVISGKTKGAQSGGVLTGAQGLENPPYVVQEGYLPYTNYTVQSAGGSPQQLEYSIPLAAVYTWTNTAVAQAWPSEAEVVIPHKDAQAVFIRAKSRMTRAETGRIVRSKESTAFGEEFRHREGSYQGHPDFGPWSAYHQKYVYGLGNSGATTATDNPPDVLTDLTLVDKARLICQAGSLPAALTADLFLARFHDDQYDEIPSNFNTVSGAGVASPVVISKLYTDPVGTGSEPDIPALVGWV